MPTLPTICAALAPFDGRTVMALQVVAWNLRDAGLLTNGRRGRGAPHLDAQDGAALLLSSLWSDRPCDAARGVTVLSTLLRKPGPKPQAGRFLAVIAQAQNFAEMVGALIEFAEQIEAELADGDLELTVSRPCPYAELALRDWKGDRRVIGEWVLDASKDKAGFYLRERADRADRRRLISVTGATVFALGAALRSPAMEEA